MQRRVVALLIGAAAVLVLVVVLFVRVRATATPPVVSPADVIAASSAAAAAPATPRSPLAPPQARPRGIGDAPAEAGRADQSPAEVGSRASAGARARARMGGDGDAEGERGNLPQDLPADTPPEMVEKRRAVSDAYDTGDYETAFRGAQEFLRFQADNEYVQRVAAVSACAIGDESSARMHYEQMNESNQRIVQVRCRRYGINL
jgi:hypothetical protein